MRRKSTEDPSPLSPCPTLHRPPSAKRQCTGMSLSSTRNEPAHYMLKIESFSILSENPTIKIESDVFEASGHKWKLELYPCGNKEDDGDNHISLYLIFCDTKSLTKGCKVLVDVKFFVYDHIGHNYVTFQDVDGNRTRFHEKQIKWGFNKLISLDDCKDSNKGYLSNDSCVFGVEVFVVPEYTLKDRCLSITKPPTTMNTYSWIIDDFSTTQKNCLTSEVFKVGKLKWTLSIFPKGIGKGEDTNLSYFLNVHDPMMFPEGWRVYAKFELRVKNQSGYDDRVKETDHWFCKSAGDSGYSSYMEWKENRHTEGDVWYGNSVTSWGFPCFMQLSEVGDISKGFLLNDRLIVEAKISVIGTLKNFV